MQSKLPPERALAQVRTVRTTYCSGGRPCALFGARKPVVAAISTAKRAVS